MKFHISKLYIWFGRELQPRILTFENNKVNVITGSSSTGKSNIYSIIDYCLLSAKPNIVIPVINETAQWYGLEFCINDQFFAIARKRPTLDVIPSDLYLQRESFNDGFYPPNANTHINDGRFILEQAFGYHIENNRYLYRSCFVFNALTESIITSPDTFLNFKFFGDDYYQDTANRKQLVKSVLTPNVQAYVKAKNEIEILNRKKRKYDLHSAAIVKKTNGFQVLLNELIQLSIASNLIDKSILSESEENQVKALESVLQESLLPLSERKGLDSMLKDLQNQHMKKTLQLENMNRAEQERQNYINSLEQIEDSLKPVELLFERAENGNVNMWTYHILDALRGSLEEITKYRKGQEQKSEPDNVLKEQLQKQLDGIDEEIGKVLRQKGSLYQQVDAMKVLGKLDIQVPLLKKLWTEKQRIVRKNIDIFTAEDENSLIKLSVAIKSFENKENKVFEEFEQCIQYIYDGLNHMEHYERCYTKYNVEQEQLMLNNGKSIFNYDIVGSQSNYMFLHLCFFMGLHRYFFENIKHSHIAQFLFIDQPSIPYYVGSEMVKTTDKEKLMDAFQAINDFMKYVIEEKKEQFQVILIEHAPESYWTGENNLEYFVTKEQFINGNALIPQYALEKTLVDAL